MWLANHAPACGLRAFDRVTSSSVRSDRHATSKYIVVACVVQRTLLVFLDLNLQIFQSGRVIISVHYGPHAASMHLLVACVSKCTLLVFSGQ